MIEIWKMESVFPFLLSVVQGMTQNKLGSRRHLQEAARGNRMTRVFNVVGSI
jgi:hypothetical protein